MNSFKQVSQKRSRSQKRSPIPGVLLSSQRWIERLTWISFGIAGARQTRICKHASKGFRGNRDLPIFLSSKGSKPVGFSYQPRRSKIQMLRSEADATLRSDWSGRASRCCVWESSFQMLGKLETFQPKDLRVSLLALWHVPLMSGFFLYRRSGAIIFLLKDVREFTKNYKVKDGAFLGKRRRKHTSSQRCKERRFYIL